MGNKNVNSKGEFWDEEYNFKNELIINKNRVSRNNLGGIQMLKKKKEKKEENKYNLIQQINKT